MTSSRIFRIYKFIASITVADKPEIIYSVSHTAQSYAEAKNFFTSVFPAGEYHIINIFAPAEPLLSSFLKGPQS